MDGEFISLEGDYYDLRSGVSQMDERLGLIIWDVLSVGLDTPLHLRKDWLERHLRQSERFKFAPYKICNSKKEILDHFDSMVQQGFEGIVVKPDAAYYAPWFKRRPSTAHDAVILAIKKTDEWLREGVPATFLVGCYDPKLKEFKPIGDVSSGLTYHEKNSIGEVALTIQTRETREYLYMEPMIVVEIDYYERRKKGLRFPKLLRIRYDKEPESCLLP